MLIAAAVCRAPTLVSNMNEIAAAPAAPVIPFALQFTISQAGIAAQTLTFKLSSKEKKT